MKTKIWGIDLGGTKIEGVVIESAEALQALTPEAAANLVRRRVPTEGNKGYEHIIGQVVRLIEQMEAEAGERRPTRIGIGTPGNISSDGLLYHSNTQCLNGRPFREDLSAALGVEVVMANDANCLALAEARIGAARGYETMMGLILGTGVGGGIVFHGRIVNGCHGIGGEWGQIVLDPTGPETVYHNGMRGTVETYLSGPALERFYAARSGSDLRLPEIVARSQQGSDPAATATMEELVSKFARSVAILINTLDPHAIVIGGGVGNIDLLYTPETREAIGQYVFQQQFSTEILRPLLGDSAGVFGAAMLVSC